MDTTGALCLFGKVRSGVGVQGAEELAERILVFHPKFISGSRAMRQTSFSSAGGLCGLWPT